jgi:hypothetical protein
MDETHEMVFPMCINEDVGRREQAMGLWGIARACSSTLPLACAS